MIQRIRMVDAKTRFSEIVRTVKRTRRPVVVTSHGKEMVIIEPIAGQSAARPTAPTAFEEIERLRTSFTSSTRAANRAAIEEGRE